MTDHDKIGKRLYDAVFAGREREVKDILKNGFEITKKIGEWSITPLTAGLQAPYPCIDVLERLVEAGIKIDQKDRYGLTALMYACQFNKYDIVQILCAAGCDVNVISKDGRSSADCAALGVSCDPDSEIFALEIIKVLQRSGLETSKIDAAKFVRKFVTRERKLDLINLFAVDEVKKKPSLKELARNATRQSMIKGSGNIFRALHLMNVEEHHLLYRLIAKIDKNFLRQLDYGNK